MLFGILGASMLENILTGKRVEAGMKARRR